MESIRIMIIEDEPMIARNLQQILSAKNYKVSHIVYDKLTAMDKLAQQNVDLVLLDINLNGQFEGLEIAATIHQKYKLPFIFITSYADEEILEKAKQSHPAGYIVKPFEEKEIYAAVAIAWHNFSENKDSDTSMSHVNEALDHPLTTKEYEVLIDLVEGKTYQNIATDHFISINTVNTHVKNIYSKLAVHSKGEALQWMKKIRR